tara:strand:+ start:2324 stop:2926 length:603 start_codon:yes stop_codon:yes gene_type:complete
MEARIKITLCSIGLATILSLQTANTAEAVSISEQGKALIQAFSSDLKSELKKAIKEGGLKNGIEVCSVKAPAIAAKYSNNGWQLKRTSLKVRNPANTATDFERDILLQFQVKKDEGIPISELSVYEQKITNTGKTHQMIKAIPTQSLCLGCHGENLSKELQSELKLRYPADQAIGFKEGDIRGAFSLTFNEIDSKNSSTQ